MPKDRNRGVIEDVLEEEDVAEDVDVEEEMEDEAKVLTLEPQPMNLNQWVLLEWASDQEEIPSQLRLG